MSQVQTKRTHIGVILGDLNGRYGRDVFWNIYDVFADKNIDVTAIYTSPVDHAETLPSVKYQFEHMVDFAQFDGVIVLAGMLAYIMELPVLTRRLERHPELKVMTLSLPLGSYPVVSIDNYASMMQLMEHLVLSCQHKRIAFVTGPANHREADERLRAYRDTIRAHQLGLSEAWIVDGNFSEHHGELAVIELLDKRQLLPDVIVCANDESAIGVMRSLRLRGIDVPGQIAVTGFDDVPQAAFHLPPLTTVRQPTELIGRHVAKALLASLSGATVDSTRLTAQLIVRESCGARVVQPNSASANLPDDFQRMMVENYQARQLGQVLEENARYLSYSTTPSGLANAMTRAMRRIGITTCDIYLYDNPKRPTAVRRLIYANGEKWVVDHDESFEPIHEALSLDGGQARTHRLIVPFHFKEGYLGCYVVDVGPRDAFIYESLRRQLGSAIKNLLFMSYLQEQNETLEQNVKERTEQLEQLLAQKQEMLGIVAHDLRGPLAGIGLGVDLLKVKRGAMPNNAIDEQLGRIRHSAERMLKITTRLLEENQQDASGLVGQLTQAPIVPIVKSVINQHSLQADAKGIRLKLIVEDLHVEARIDEDLFAMALTNLVNNALKYSPPEKQVIIWIGNFDADVRIDVIDQGKGITEEDKVRMFGRFTRLSAQPTAGESTTGMGLYIAKKMVEAMAGRLSAESRAPRQGSVFSISLPLISTSTSNISDTFFSLTPVDSPKQK